MSVTSTPASASNNATEEKQAPTLAEVVRKLDTENLIEFLRGEEDLQLNETHFEIIRNEEIAGRDFLKLTEEKLRSYGMKGGPASRIVDFAKEVKEKKLRSFSSYRSLKEVLTKYGIDGNGIGTIRQFPPAIYKLEDEEEELQQCIKEIKRRMGNMGSVLADSNEAMRCEYISVILHASLYVVKRITKKELTLDPQLEVIGEESTGRVDYAIKALEELICITEGKLHQIAMDFAQNLIQCESAMQVNKKKRKADDAFGEDFDYLYGIVTTATEWYFILYASDGFSSTSKSPLNIKLTELALKKDSEEELELHKNVKRVMEVIVGILKDRVDVEKEPAMKKQRVQGFFEKQE